MYTFPVEIVLEVITNIKIVSLKDQNTSASARQQRYFKINIFAPKFASPICTHACANFQTFIRKPRVSQKMKINLVG